jgi:hypothetical protein
LVDHHQFSHELKQALIDYLRENVHAFSYQIMADLAVLYASKMDKHYKELFF